jgi:transposase
MRRQASAHAGERLRGVCFKLILILNLHIAPMIKISTPLHDTKACLGIDISKAHLDACLLTELPTRHRYRRKVRNTRSGIQELLGWLKEHHAEPIAAVLESTGHYGEMLAHLLHEAGHRVSVVNPGRVKQYAQSQGRHNKTDEVDAEIIARFGFTQELPQWQPLPEAQATLRALLRRREDVSAQLQAEANRLEACPTDKGPVPQSLRRIIALLSKELVRLEAAISEHIKTHPDLAADCARLEAIPGIGAKSAQWLVAELPGTLENSRAAAAWAGVAPRLSESGTLRKPSRIGPAGNRFLRKALYFPAISARTHNPRFKVFADRLAERGLSKMAIIMAVLHKLVRTAFAILKNQSAYDPSHISITPKTTQNPS